MATNQVIRLTPLSMKTRISIGYRNSCQELIVDDGTKGEARKVLASMTLFEGTRAWMLTDLRLSQYRVPSQYSGGLSADAVSAHYKPENEAEAARVRELLREYTEDVDGFHWTTFDGLVRGTPRLESAHMRNLSRVGFFSRAEGRAYLQDVQAWWAKFDGQGEWRLPNPHRQMSESELRFALRYPDLAGNLASV